ncbi:MAG: MBOAT family protein [Lachnospiraceae bacterium]|nr:MBOAT family protein [Lachnospiraceae bacterium]
MYFNSYIFIFIFVPTVLIIYGLLNRKGLYKASQLSLLCMSLLFYSFGNIALLFLILASLFVNHLCSFMMEKTGMVATFGITAIVFDLGLLFYFKYADFFTENINLFLAKDLPLRHIILPMGISFYTFQQIGYIADRMRKDAGHYPLIEYASFVTFFPQLVAGPIVSHDALVPQFSDRNKKDFDRVNFSKGLELFIAGLSKKILIADMLAPAVDHAYDNIAALDTLSAVTAMLLFTFQLYFDFSGYSDMAVGLGKMMNIDLPQNFDSPYRSGSIREFWKRWHITLNRFFVKYVYIPLGGSKKGNFIKELNVLAVFILSGLWHGAAWTFVLWGLLNGVAIVLEDIFRKALEKMEKNRFGNAVKHAGCFVLVNIFWVVFRCEKLADIPLFFSRLFAFKYNGFFMELAKSMDNGLLYIPRTILSKINPGAYYLTDLIFIVFMLAVSMLVSLRKEVLISIEKEEYKGREVYVFALLGVLCTISLSKIVVFLYSNF